MGKKLIILGADFSENGIRTSNVVNVEMIEGGTNPYNFYFLPTALSTPDLYTSPTMPGDAVANEVTEDGDIAINSAYTSFYAGRTYGMSENVRLKSLNVNYNKSSIADFTQSFRGTYLNALDLRNISFANGVNCRYMFALADIIDLKMPDIVVGNATYMFYNFNSVNNAPTDFSFIKKITGVMANMFHYLKASSANFKGIDVSEATNMNDVFLECKLDDIDISTWVNSSMTHCGSMFKNTLARTLHLDNWEKTVADWASSDMFVGANNLTTVFVTNCSSTVKTWLLGKLNGASAGGSNNWIESTVDGKAALVKGS